MKANLVDPRDPMRSWDITIEGNRIISIKEEKPVVTCLEDSSYCCSFEQCGLFKRCFPDEKDKKAPTE